MKIVILILLLISIKCYSQQTNVVVALSGTIADEPHLQDSFILGYESAGGTYTGTFTILENTGVVNGFKYADTNGYTCVLRNSGNAPSIANQIDSFYNKGIQYITCGGDNGYHLNSLNNVTLTNAITCGGGETENMTSYPIEFYGIHFGYKYPITNITQSGVNANVTVDISNGIFYVNYLYRVTFSNVLGFSNNPNGIIPIVTQSVNYTQFLIFHNLGTGSFISGDVSVFYQSYAHAYIAGQIAYIKDQLGCSWWEARYRARVTGSENNIYNIYNGYGYINLSDAINYNGIIPIDPYDTLIGSAVLTINRNDNLFILTIDTVTNALKYELYDNETLLTTIFRNNFIENNEFNITKKLKSEGGKHKFYYKAIRNEQSITSNIINKSWLYYNKIYKK